MLIEPHRGDFLDRFGRQLTEELNDFVTLSVNPKRVTKPYELAQDLAKLTNRSPGYYLKRLKSSTNYIPLVRKIPPEVADEIDKLDWKLCRQTESRRIYPHNELAGQLLGCIDIDNNGIAGLELTCDSLLKGIPGWRIYQLDVKGQPHLAPNLAFKPPIDGCDVMLTIDLRIQSIIEEELADAIEIYQAKNASCIVLDPRTGEILAMASAPLFNPNKINENSISNQKIRPICDVFEPGSVIKIVASSFLIEKGLAVPTTRVDCSDGFVTVCGEKIYDTHRCKVLTLEEIITYSSNVGTVKLTLSSNQKELYDIIKKFGFLQKTGIELPGEMDGFIPPPKSWSNLTKANIVIGHSIAVTALQVAMAYSVIANDGVLMKPMLIKGYFTPNGQFNERKPEMIRRVISPKTARTIKYFLFQVVEKGTGRKAKLENVTVAGKTGTAEKINPEGGYFKDRNIVSFAGLFPVDEPKYVIYVVVDEPIGKEHFGADVAAPVFRKIASRILDLQPNLKNVKKSKNKSNQDKYITVPDLKSKLFTAVKNELNRAGLVIHTHGSGNLIIDQSPPAGKKLKTGDAIELVLGPKQRNIKNRVVVPLLVGLSLRDALLKASQLGLTIQVHGTGKVVSQSPPSGSLIKWGDVCILNAEG